MSEQSSRTTPSEGVPVDLSEEDDSISLTSTAPDLHDSDEEFVVEEVRAARYEHTGELRYLIQWQGYPLHQNTWEPASNIGEELIERWDENKQRLAEGEEEEYVRAYEAAYLKAAEEKAERHRRRNAKRKKLGLPLTPPYPEEPPEAKESSSSDESLEDFYANQTKKNLVGKKPLPEASITPTTASTPKAKKNGNQAEVQNANTKAVTTVDKDSTKKKSTSSTSTTSRVPPERPSSSGSHGTTRKSSGPSAGLNTAGGKSKPTAPTQATVSPLPGRATAAASTVSRYAGLKAKKTAPGKQPTGNIFTSGRVRKPRTNLQQAMSDTTKEPKLFSKHRYLRLAEKRSRDMEDLPIPLSAVIPLNINTSAQGRQTSKESHSPVPSLPTPTAELKPAIVAREEVPLKKKRKSVRWLEEDDSGQTLFQEPEPMDIDSPTTTNRPSHSHPRLRSPPPPRQEESSSPRKLSLDEYRSKILLQSLEKNIVLGSTAPIKVTFNGLPREPAQDWVSNFIAQEAIEFRYTCLSKTIMHRFGELVQVRLGDGTITSENESVIDATAEYLRSGLLGLYSTHPNYSIIIYPTRCDEWKELLTGQEPSSPSGIALRYVVFHTTVGSQGFLKPYDIKSTAVDKPVPGTSPLTPRQLIMGRLFNFDYTKLVPAKPSLPSAHGFFVAFPPSRQTSALAFHHWLRDCNPQCRIYHSHQPGSWAAFRASINDKQIRGSVIVHETLVQSLYRFPGLSDMLMARRFEDYWCFSESSQSRSMYQSLSISECLRSPGNILFSRLFPARTVIMITPSFLVSEPQRAKEFFQWFLENSKRQYYKLVTAWNIHEYLLDLATEKSKERNDLESRNQSDKSNTKFEIDTNLAGLSEANCRDRYDAAAIALELHCQRKTAMRLYGAGEFEDFASPIIYADRAIDPNDEQSLVNWFGWWTTLRLDQFRKFYVIGSNATIGYNQKKTGERRILMPRYTRATVNDPDAAPDGFRKHGEEGGQHVGGPNAQLFSNGVNTPKTGTSVSSIFKSDLVNSESFMIPYLGHLVESCKSAFYTVYRFPVSWLDSNMAKHFGDWKEEFCKVSDWFQFTWSFSEEKKFNTYIGLFYTVTEDWVPDDTTGGFSGSKTRPRRYPWLVIYRPVNCHLKPYKRCEVIIWDPLAKAKFPGSRTPAEKDLLDMQRRVIHYICDHTAEKNPGTHIDQVWLGGFEYPDDCESPYPFDITAKFLRHLLKDIKTYLPAPEKVMPKRGYRKVIMGQRPGMSFNNPIGGNPMDIDQPQDEGDPAGDDDPDARIIFHPPRSLKLPAGQRSKCTNKLYEEVRLARAHSAGKKQGTHMPYAFVPTEDWYREQQNEGRGFEHISVKEWEYIFNYYQIGISKAVVEGSTTDESGRESPLSL